MTILAISSIRKILKLNQHDFGVLVERSRQSVQRWEAGKEPPDAVMEWVEVLNRLARGPKKRRPNLHRILQQHGRIEALRVLLK